MEPVQTRVVKVGALISVSSVFHYLGPALAVLLFVSIDELGVAWLRIASAAVVLALWRRPWRAFLAAAPRDRWTIAALGVVLAAMNACFYLAIARLPLSTVGAIEFLGVVALAAIGLRGRRNLVALVLAVAGVAVLSEIRIVDDPLGFVLAFANCGLFMLYVMLGHRISNSAAAGGGIDRLAGAMMFALIAVTPIGLAEALPAFTSIALLAAAVGVGLCSSVIPYVADQLAMRMVRRSTFALLLCLLPVSATVMGLVVLQQLPTVQDLVGIALVVVAVAVHRPAD